MSDAPSRDAIMEILAQTEGVGLLFIILNEEHGLSLRQAISIIPNSDDLLAKIVTALGTSSKQEIVL